MFAGANEHLECCDSEIPHVIGAGRLSVLATVKVGELSLPPARRS